MLKTIVPKIIGTYINILALFSPHRAAHKGFLIFCTVRSGRIKPEQEALLEAAKHERLLVNGNEVQTYHWAGTGPTVLLIHGWESNSHRWWKLLKNLQHSNYNVYAFDAPAHGASAGRILNVVLYTQALQVVTQRYTPQYHIAHSIGALTSIYHYYKHQPQHLVKMVTLGTASELSEIMSDYKKIMGFSSRVIHTLEDYVENKFGFTFIAFSGAAFAKAITVPGLIIHDKEDQITPVRASRAIHKSWKNSTYIETEGLGHSLYQDEVRQAILDFIAE